MNSPSHPGPFKLCGAAVAVSINETAYLVKQGSWLSVSGVLNTYSGMQVPQLVLPILHFVRFTRGTISQFTCMSALTFSFSP